MKFKISDDGRTHINVYSQGKTSLGRFLSNFAYSPIQTEDGSFLCIEGYWYWLLCPEVPGKEKLRTLLGADAKELGRMLGATDWDESDSFKNKIKSAIKVKIETRPDMLEELKKSKLPLTHYYVYSGKIVKVPGAKWILDYIESLK